MTIRYLLPWIITAGFLTAVPLGALFSWEAGKGEGRRKASERFRAILPLSSLLLAVFTVISECCHRWFYNGEPSGSLQLYFVPAYYTTMLLTAWATAQWRERPL